MQIWIVFNSVDTKVEEVSSTLENAVTCSNVCNKAYGQEKCVVLGSFMMDAGYSNIARNSPANSATYADHMRKFGISVEGDRQSQWDAQRRAMGHDPATHDRVLAQRRSKEEIRPRNPSEPVNDYPQNDYIHMSKASEVSEPDPTDPVADLTNALRGIDSEILHNAMSALENETQVIDVPSPASLDVDMKH